MHTDRKYVCWIPQVPVRRESRVSYRKSRENRVDYAARGAKSCDPFRDILGHVFVESICETHNFRNRTYVELFSHDAEMLRFTYRLHEDGPRDGPIRLTSSGKVAPFAK